VQAKGLDLASQERVQVSMNLLKVDAVGPGRVFREIERRAGEAGVEVARSELVGLMPRSAAVGAAGELLRLEVPLAERVLEDRLDALFDPTGPLERSAAQIAGPGALDPGGGSAVALGLALGRACLAKAIALSRDGKGELSEEELDALEADLPDTASLFALASDDHRAFASMMAAFRLPRGEARKSALRETRGQAVAVPQRMLELAISVAEAAATLAERGNGNLINDALAAAELALAAGRVARLNARANQRKKDRDDLSGPLARLEQAARRAREATE
jgi:glutamate formiminotransferase/glutamate formiminotransferase/formiminotetrahydrofolate cyclodeaminase